MAVIEVAPFAVPKIPNQTTGNVAVIGNRLNTSLEALYFVIQAPKTGTIQRVFCYIQNVLTPGTLKCTLESIGADGRPSGIKLIDTVPGSDATKTITNSPGGSGWNSFTLQVPTFVAKGQHIAIGFANPQSGFGDFEVCTGNFDSNVFPYVVNRATNGSYSAQEAQPLVSLEYTDTTYPRIFEGMTFLQGIPAQAGNIIESGLKFKLTFNTRIAGFWTCFGEGSVTNEWRLYDDGDQALAAKITTYGNFSIGFIRQYFLEAKIPLFKDRWYRLVVRLNTGSITPCGGIVFSPEFSQGVDGETNFLYTERTATSPTWLDRTTQHPIMGIFCDQLDVDTFGGTGFIPPSLPEVDPPIVTQYFPGNQPFLETPLVDIAPEQGIYYT